MAMEQGEKRAIHPFFYFGIQAKSASQPTSVVDTVASHDTAQNNAPIVHDETVNESPVTTLEHDPNSSRRKRRRTDRHEVTSIGNGTPSDDEEEVSAPAEPVTIHSDAGTAPAIETNVPTSDDADLSTSQQTITQNSAPTGPANTIVQTQATRSSERQRTLRLNPNGKLLSSPIGKQAEEKEQNKQDNRGSKKGSRKSKKDDNKPVIIQYASNESARERLGKMIDDIINGRTRQEPQPPAPVPGTIPTAITPTPARIPRVSQYQPPKATHPFFLKKSSRKPDTPIQPHEDSTAFDSPVEATRRPLSLTREGSGITSTPSFRPRVSKFPEPIHPLWPPRDFVHVRGAKVDTNRAKESFHSANTDQKKAKGVTIRIHDQENVLLSGEYGQSMKKNIPQSLRLPTRFVASGKVLGKAITSQLSDYSSRSKHGDTAIKKDTHAGISRLYSLLATSMTAFDRGMCDTCLWAQKHAPTSAPEVLQTGKEAHMLRDWLKFLIISAVDTGKSSRDAEKAKQKAEEKKRAKKRKKTDKLDGFILSSEEEASEMGELSESEEDELAGDVTVSHGKRTVIRSGDLAAGLKGCERGRMTNAILLSGPSGCGKTASVYAVAKELGFEVFEINSGSRRNGRDVVERVGDMTRNHIVHKLYFDDEGSSQPLSDATTQEAIPEDGKQNKLMSFFKPKLEATKETKATPKVAEPEADSRRSQKQSLILLEEADILFEEDRHFWSGVMSLIQQSRRPIIITCNDENLIPLEDISFHAILRYRPPPLDLAVDYLLLMAANEGHMLQRNAVSDLYRTAGNDLRRAIMDLNFWCQMAIGSNKSGLDWMMDRWPPGADRDQSGDTLRVLSLNTYQQYMGWFSRDMLLDSTLESEVESQQESLHWWERSIQDSESMAFSSSHLVPGLSVPESEHEQLEQLRYESEYADMRSALDILCTGCPVDSRLDAVDPSVPPMPEKHKANYIEGQQLLHADLKPEYSSLAIAIGSTSEVLIGKTFRSKHNVDVESSQAAQVLANTNKVNSASASGAQLTTAFEPMMRGDDQPAPSARLAPSFHNGPGPLWEDLAPYVRAIVAFDLRLEQYRLKLSGLLSPSSGSKRKMRKTRASRAALEGGDKSNTRREKWFPPDTNPSRILATGNKEWQDLLVQSGHFTVGAMPEPSKESSREPSREPGREGSEPASESSGDGGI